MDSGVYHVSLAYVLRTLRTVSEEHAFEIALHLAESKRPLALEWLKSAVAINARLDSSDMAADPKLDQFLSLYLNFSKNMNPDFTEISSTRKVFAGNIFAKKVVTKPEDAEQNIMKYLYTCHLGAADPQWFS